MATLAESAARRPSAMAATGDLHGNIEKLRDHLRRVHYDSALQVDALAAGEPAGFLPLLHFVLLRHSHAVARWLAERGYELSAKTDLRFVETVYRLARVELGYRHALTSKQFLSPGFAERKVLFVIDLLRLVQEKHAAMSLEREKSRKIAPGECADSVQRLYGAAAPAPTAPQPPAAAAEEGEDDDDEYEEMEYEEEGRARSAGRRRRPDAVRRVRNPRRRRRPPPRRLCGARAAAVPAARPSRAAGAEAHLLAEVTELRRLVLRVLAARGAGRRPTRRRRSSRRAALLEGRVKLVEAAPRGRRWRRLPPMAPAEAVDSSPRAARPPLAPRRRPALAATAGTAANLAAALGGRNRDMLSRIHRRHQPPDEPRRRSGGSCARRRGWASAEAVAARRGSDNSSKKLRGDGLSRYGPQLLE